MGSRRGRHAALVVAALLSSATCSRGAPPGFSDGDRWVVPLIGPLEDGLLLVPATVNGKGPFVFSIDPDAHVSIVDAEVVKASQPATGEGPKMLDETDTEHSRFYAEILEWRIGTLTVKGPKPAQIANAHVFDAAGRRIHGVLGSDIIAESLVFGFDRDTGVLTLTTQQAFKPSTSALPLTYSRLDSQVRNAEVVPQHRRLLTALINGEKVTLHVDLGATPSQLRTRSWAKAKLVESDLALGLVDEAGTMRTVRKQGVAERVEVGMAVTKGVVFVPYEDKRWPDQHLEGALGLGFFTPYAVTANWDKNTLYLEPRKERDLKTRIARWQSSTLTGCANPGCVRVSLVDPLAGKPPEQMPAKHPGVVASVVRDPSAAELDLEVLVAASPPEGKGALKWLVANMPKGSNRAMTHLPPDYVGSTLEVVDVGMFPRACAGSEACIDLLIASRLPVQRTAPPGADVPPTLLEGYRISGAMTISPDDVTKDEIKAANLGQGSSRLVSTFRVCLDAHGAIESVEILAPSGFDAYDQKVLGQIKDTWRYKPYVRDGKPIAVCTKVTFIYNQKW